MSAALEARQVQPLPARGSLSSAPKAFYLDTRTHTRTHAHSLTLLSLPPSLPPSTASPLPSLSLSIPLSVCSLSVGAHQVRSQSRDRILRGDHQRPRGPRLPLLPVPAFVQVQQVQHGDRWQASPSVYVSSGEVWVCLHVCVGGGIGVSARLEVSGRVSVPLVTTLADAAAPV